MTASIGPGVTYVSSEPVTSSVGQGRASIYAFTDVSQLRISTQPAAPAGIKIRTQGFSTEAGIGHLRNARATPAATPCCRSTCRSRIFSTRGLAERHRPDRDDQDDAGRRARAAGGRTGGTVVRTSSPYVEGSRVTLLEVDLDEVLKDETLLPRLQAAATPDEAKAIVKGAAGLKINLDRAITIEFTPKQ